MNYAANEQRVVIIREVNTANHTIIAEDNYGTLLQLTWHLQTPLVSVPVPGEVWLIERQGVDWFLERRTESASAVTKLTDLQPGDARVEATGRLILNANEVFINGTLWSQATPTPVPQTISFDGSWQPPVADVPSLPLTGNSSGDIRLVLANFNLYAWDSATSQWLRLSAGAAEGGGGGGGGGTVTAPNLFVSATAPPPGNLVADSWWLPLNVDGTPKTVDQWQFWTGTGNTNGGNFFIQPTRPTPSVDSLWIPTDGSSNPLYIDQWEVITGRGSQTGIGNSNLYISIAPPTIPIIGSLWIPLNAIDETAKTADQWEVYT